jgi:hypothetical protein
MVPQHGLFSLHTILEGSRLHITAFPTHMIRPLDESQGSTPLQGHGSWLMCEVALSAPARHARCIGSPDSIKLNHHNILKAPGAMWAICGVVQNTKVHLGTLPSVLPIVPRNQRNDQIGYYTKLGGPPHEAGQYRELVLESYIIRF